MNAFNSSPAFPSAAVPAAGAQLLRVVYFASVREALGLASEEVRTEAATVEALRAELMARSPVYAAALDPTKAVRAALNQVMCTQDAPLCAGAEVAFFPPVTGG